MKILFLADLHLHASPAWRLAWMDKFIDELLQEQHTKYKDHDLYLMGDVTEARDFLDARVANQLIRLLAGWKQGEVLWLTGQHDSYVPGRATFEAMRETGCCIIIDQEVYHHTKNNVWFVPFARQTQHYRDMLAKVPDGALVMTHMPLKEIIEMYGGKIADGISVEEFNRFKHSYSGDIHKWHDFPKFTYIGAPSQRDWRDKGVVGVVATLIDGQFTRIPTKHPVHLEVSSEDEIPTDVECILRMKPGVVAAGHHNVLATTPTVELKPQSVQVVAANVETVISDYVKKNMIPGAKYEQVCEYAQNSLKDAETNA